MIKEKEIRFRRVKSEDVTTLWRWRNDPVTRRMSFYSKNISLKEFTSWLKKKLAQPDTMILIGQLAGRPIGQVRFDFKNRNYAEVNIALDPAFRKKGLGTRMLVGACELMFREEELKRIIAHIKLENLVSVRAFEKAGFINIGLKNIRGFNTIEMLCQNSLPEKAKRHPLKVLAVVAHPDDEVLGCGGTLIKHADVGDEVSVAILGEGKTSRYELGDNQANSENELKRFETEIKGAMELLGVKHLFRSKFPDNRFDSVDLLDIVKVLEKLKEELHPDIVYTHHRFDINLDHLITAQAVTTAFRPIAGEMVSKLLAFETPSSTEWQTPGHGMDFSPNHYVDISSLLDRKLKALECYQSELRLYPHPRSLKSIELIAKRWGINVGLFAAEPFMLLREILF
jgi:LmbE family N-acetylglucosaminyl deacetylase/RimJ/RimL family protein N-acetyltransferase